MQLGFVGRVAFPDDRGLVGALGQMAIDAIVGGVGLAVLVPIDRDVMRIPRDVADLGVGLEPVDALALVAPEAVGVLDRALVHLLVAGLVDPGALGPVRRIRRTASRTSFSPWRARERAYVAAICPSAAARFKPNRLWPLVLRLSPWPLQPLASCEHGAPFVGGHRLDRQARVDDQRPSWRDACRP